MLKVAVIGDRESSAGFGAIGMDVFVPSDKENCREILETVCGNGYAIIFITEEFALYCKDITEKFADKIYPAIILIPGSKNNTGEGMELLLKSVEKAVGSKLPE